MQSTSTMDEQYNCSICNESCENVNELKLHLHLHIYPNCDMCNMLNRFSALEAFKKHILSHFEDKQNVCEKCGTHFKSPYFLKRHMVTHNMLLPGGTDSSGNQVPVLLPSSDSRYECGMCGKKYATANGLQMHMQQHSNEYPYTCSTCNERFKIAAKLRHHMVKHEEPQHTCDTCGKKFYRIFGLKRHAFLHSGNKPFTCFLCNKSFADASYLKAHAFTHVEHGEQKDRSKQQCNYCGKLLSKPAIKRHILAHTGEQPHKCTICNKTFNDPTCLTRHILIHTGVRKFKCSECGKAFKNSHELTRHSRYIHTFEKPYKCDVCGKQFVEKASRKRHLLKHSGEKPYGCLLCRKRYSDMTGLRYHKRVAHTGKESEADAKIDNKSSKDMKSP